MNASITIIIQSLVITIVLFFLAIIWAGLCSPVAICLRRDRNIVGQNLI